MRIRKHEPVKDVLKEDDIMLAAKIADALAHPARIRMLRHILAENLARRPVTNKDLVLVFDYAQATVSQHISKLLIGGLLDMRKKGTSSCYYARIGRLSVFSDTLKKIETPNEINEINETPSTEFYGPQGATVELDDELNPEYTDEPEIDPNDETPSFL